MGVLAKKILGSDTMKDITIEQFSTNTPDALSAVLFNGDIIRISTDRGNVVLMEEAEYNIMREALELIIKLK